MKLLVLSLLFILVVEAKPESRFIGGSLAEPGQYPWMAAIYITKPSGQFFCAGSIFKEQWILTAAQCVVDATSFKIQVGSNLLEGEDPNRVTVTSTKSIYVETYNASSLVNDIALIKLEEPLTFNDYIKPVVMLAGAMAPIYQGVQVEAAGWGQTADTGDLSNELRYSYLTVVGQAQCKVFYGAQLGGAMTCTQGANNEGPCFGDIGTPLMAAAPVGDHTIQVAVASMLSGNGCESKDPVVYTLTDAYWVWIMQKIRDN